MHVLQNAAPSQRYNEHLGLHPPSYVFACPFLHGANPFFLKKKS